MRETVDVIIPNYNEYENLCIAIDSCLNQDAGISSIIIVDDGSSKEIQKKLSERWGSNSKIRFYFNGHSGLPGLCREAGVNNSDADWIAFLDSDDYWNQEKISKQLQAAKEMDAVFIATNAVKLLGADEVGNVFDSLPPRLSFARAVQSNFIINSSVLVKRKVLSEEFSYATSHNVRAVEDYATWLRILTKYDCLLLNESLTFYRESLGSIRKGILGDPRGHAFADFLTWSKIEQNLTGKDLQVHRNLILEQIALDS